MPSNHFTHLLFFLLVLVICLAMLRCGQTESEINGSKYPARVGDIAEDPLLDEADFQLCDENWIQQHYSFRNLYKGGKNAIERAFKEIDPASFGPDLAGYITIRFIVNCKRETGRFRVQEMNFNYQPTHFPKKLVERLLAATKGLDKWQPANYERRAYDYYSYLTFKIDSGKIASILP